MVSESITKLKREIRTFVLLVADILLCVLLAGCDLWGRAELYPYDIAEKWVCDDPKITIEFSTDDNGIPHNSEFLYWNEETIALDFTFLANQFTVYHDGVTIGTDYILFGTYTYRDGNLVFRIEEDNIFDGAYTELVFCAEE